MAARFPEVLLAAYNSRSRVARGRDGIIHLLWDTLGMRMTQGEFVSFVRLVTEAVVCPARCGELASGSCGRVARCSMGQIMLSYDRRTPGPHLPWEHLGRSRKERLSTPTSLLLSRWRRARIGRGRASKPSKRLLPAVQRAQDNPHTRGGFAAERIRRLFRSVVGDPSRPL